MADDKPNKFVWVMWMGRFAAEKWPGDAPGGCTIRDKTMGAELRRIVSEHALTDADMLLPIAELAKRYPRPGGVATLLTPAGELHGVGFWA